MAIQPVRRLVIVPDALATRRQESVEVRPRVLQRIEDVVVAIEPKRWLSPGDAAFQESLIDRGGVQASPGALPASDEIDDGAHRGMLSAPTPPRDSPPTAIRLRSTNGWETSARDTASISPSARSAPSTALATEQSAPSSFSPSEPPRPRRDGAITAQPRPTNHCAMAWGS